MTNKSSSGVDVVFPARANGAWSTACGTKFYQGGVEIKDVSAFGMPTANVDGILEVTLTIPLNSVSYGDALKIDVKGNATFNNPVIVDNTK